jgi:hypothetical protein
VVVAAHPDARGALCRRCNRVSTRVHSRYRRHLAGRPTSGRPVEVVLTVRRFFCDHIDCSACTYVEQVPGLTERHARRSPGVQAALVAVGLALLSEDERAELLGLESLKYPQKINAARE